MTASRSPSYPSLTLREAVDLARKVHDANRTNPTDREAAAKDMGYAGLTGSSTKSLADLVHYGLLEKAGKGGVRVTDLAVDILHPINQEQRVEALRRAATSPTLFQKLDQHFHAGTPSRNSLSSYLSRMGFASGPAALVVNSYTGTHRFLQEENVTESFGRAPENQADSESSVTEAASSPGREPAGERGTPLATVPARREITLAEGERVIFVEEAAAGQYLKLVATGAMDDTLLEALEDFAKRQRKRMARAKKEAPSEEAEDAGDEDSGGQVH